MTEGNSYFYPGMPQGRIPGGAFIFGHPDGTEVLRVSADGFFLRGVAIEDAGALHAAMLSYFSDPGPLAEALADAVEGLSPSDNANAAMERLVSAYRAYRAVYPKEETEAR